MQPLDQGLYQSYRVLPTPTGPPRCRRPSPPRASPGNSTPWTTSHPSWRHNPRASLHQEVTRWRQQWRQRWFRTVTCVHQRRRARTRPRAHPPTCTTGTSVRAASRRCVSRRRNTRRGSATRAWPPWRLPASRPPSPRISTPPWAPAPPSCKVKVCSQR